MLDYFLFWELICAIWYFPWNKIPWQNSATWQTYPTEWKLKPDNEQEFYMIIAGKPKKWEMIKVNIDKCSNGHS